MVYTDVWASMGQKEEAEKRKRVFKDFQVSCFDIYAEVDVRCETYTDASLCLGPKEDAEKAEAGLQCLQVQWFKVPFAQKK